MGRKVQKNLNLPLPVAQWLEDESDETGKSQAALVQNALTSCYSIEVEA